MERYTHPRGAARAAPQNPSWSKLPETEGGHDTDALSNNARNVIQLHVDESVLSVQSYVTKIRQTLDKKPPKCMILFRPGTILTNPVSIVSEYNESPKDVQPSLSAHTCRQHCAKKRNLIYWALNQIH